MQDSLPAGGLRLCRAGVEPAGSLREVSGHIIPLSRALPGAISRCDRVEIRCLSEFLREQRKRHVAMTEDILLPFDLPAVRRKKVTADFEGGLISSDGGLVLLRGAERRLGLSETLAGCHPGVARPGAGGPCAAGDAALSDVRDRLRVRGCRRLRPPATPQFQSPGTPLAQGKRARPVAAGSDVGNLPGRPVQTVLSRSVTGPVGSSLTLHHPRHPSDRC